MLEISLRYGASITLSNALWYAAVASGAWVFFYVLFRNVFRHRRIGAADVRRSQVLREMWHSLRSLAIFGIVAGLVVWCAIMGWTQIYERIGKYGWMWFFVSIGVMIVIHDTYFYWTHRLMHWRGLYHLFHRTHHLSTSPTPWAAYAFSPLEAFVQAGIAPVILFTLPVHPLAFSIFMAWQISFNVMGHCGYEIFPRWFLANPVGKFLNSPTHHALHHEKFRANYSLYFNVWDRLMGTNHAEYAARFEKATGASAAGGSTGHEWQAI
jgi:sterol desaturase/sphingolipid hydroxylase (fatty acid hydroxylase superfamily)